MKQFVSRAVVALLLSCGLLSMVQTASADAPGYAYPQFPVAYYGQPISSMPYQQIPEMPYQQFPSSYQQFPTIPYQQLMDVQYRQYQGMMYYQPVQNTQYQQVQNTQNQQVQNTQTKPVQNTQNQQNPNMAYVNPAYGMQAPAQQVAPTQMRAYTRSEIRSLPITARPNRPGHFIGNTIRRRAGVGY